MTRGSPVILDRRFVPAGSVIMHQGDAGNSAYLVQSGSVEIFVTKDLQEVVLAKLGLGQIFGEMALIFDEPRAASVRAAEDCNLIVITRNSFKQKLEKSDPTIRAIVQMFAKRIVTANNTLLNKRSDMEDLLDTVQTIYQNVLMTLPQNRQRVFQNTVLPALDNFINAVSGFEERFKEE